MPIDNYGLVVLGPSGIQMDTPKAMAILGFSSSQTFEATSMEVIKKAYLKRFHEMIRFETKSNRRPKEIERRRQEMKRINEALQCLIKRRSKCQAMEEWKRGGKHLAHMALALRALDEEAQKALDFEYKEAQEKYFQMAKLESKLAQELAIEIESSIESPLIIEHKLSKSNRHAHYFLVTVRSFSFR